MTREELLKQKEIVICEIDSINKKQLQNESLYLPKKDKDRRWELQKQYQDLERQIDKLDGKTYVNEKWITKFLGKSYNSLKEARFNLIEQIKDLPGVKIGKTETGVVGVTVYTEYKIYYFSIHAHYRVEKIEESKRIEKDFFGTDHEVYDYAPIYCAWAEPSGDPRWVWRY